MRLSLGVDHDDAGSSRNWRTTTATCDAAKATSADGTTNSVKRYVEDMPTKCKCRETLSGSMLLDEKDIFALSRNLRCSWRLPANKYYFGE